MELLILDTDFVSIDIIDTFDSLIWTDRYNEYGDFELVMSVEHSHFDSIKENHYIWMKESEHCMIIETISINTDVEKGNSLVISGRSLESILDRRIVWVQTTLTGNFQNGIETLLNDAIISPSIVDRKIDNFIFEPSTDPYVTDLTINTQITGDSIYDVVKTFCKLYDIGFKIVLNDNNQLVFSLYFGKDRSYDQIENPYVVFSPEFENVLNTNYVTSNRYLKTITLVAGEGEGVSRRTTTVGSGIGIDRRELFTDARDISSDVDGGTLTNEEYDEKLETRGISNLLDYVYLQAFDGEMETSKTFTYGEDFYIGDIVQMVNEYGNEGRVYISEMIFSYDENGVAMYPTFQTI